MIFTGYLIANLSAPLPNCGIMKFKLLTVYRKNTPGKYWHFGYPQLGVAPEPELF